MKLRTEFNTITTIEEIDREIKERRIAIQSMVGWLYPSILCDEIDELYRLRKILECELIKFKPIVRVTGTTHYKGG